MQINIQHKGDVTVVNLAGNFDGGNDCEKFQNSISGLLEKGYRKIIISFSLIRWINSCGIGKLIAIHEVNWRRAISCRFLDGISREVSGRDQESLVCSSDHCPAKVAHLRRGH